MAEKLLRQAELHVAERGIRRVSVTVVLVDLGL